MPRRVDPEDVPSSIDLVHPVYLDVPMMVTFLAAMRDGVQFEGTVTRKEGSSTDRLAEGTGKVKLPSLASLFGLEASGKISRRADEEISEETQYIRQHTAASLFNALLEALREESLLREVTSAEDLDLVAPGDVVEVSGQFIGNPLEPLVAFVRQAAPYFEMLREPADLPGVDLAALELEVTGAENLADELDARTGKAKRSGNPVHRATADELQQRASEAREQARIGRSLLDGAKGRREQEQAVELLSRIGDELAESPVQDTVIRVGDLQAVLTMSAEFFSDTTRAHLRAGEFRAVGKVTRVLQEGEQINLLRRTVLGAAQPDVGQDMIRAATQEESLRLETFEPVITAPALQILPLAVFI